MKFLKNVSFSLLLFPFVFVAVGFLLFAISGSVYEKYDKAVDVTAVVTDTCYKSGIDADDTPYSYYEIYVDYSFDKQEYHHIFWRTDRSDMTLFEKVTVKIVPSAPNQPLEEEPTTQAFGGIVLMIVGIFLAFKIVPAAIGDKNDPVEWYPVPGRSKSRFLWLAITIIPAVIFTLLGINSSALFIIGTIAFAYFTVVLWEMLI